MNLTTSYHLLNTLESEGFIARDSSRRLRLGHRIGELAAALQDLIAPDPTLIEFLEDLNHRTRETAYLGVWRDDAVVSVAVREGRGGVRVSGIHLGYSEHGYARALGRALLAFRDDRFLTRYLETTKLEPLTPQTITDPAAVRKLLEKVRETGVAIEREEFQPDVCCVAAPIFAGRQEAVGALSVSVPKSRFTDSEDAIVRELRAVTAQASIAMGGEPLKTNPA